ncbi:histidine kinase [Bacillus sp. M6-12]|uniref:sensor histidine kinase n=1 Tax=Bacillus sp. M6-12 TaxID=2054166 RepID=UPI000C786A15|nr:HAMP domain-containing sensor histidine kinase [Bacillus sp. M6-12]PLS18525.1 histidine kinase [Bacillus sp. M6-12]
MESSLEQKSYVQDLLMLLEKQQTAFLEEWQAKIYTDEADPHLDKILDNGIQMYNIIKKAINGSISEDEVKMLAYKVAMERLESEINIGDFVYNVNVGRSIIVDKLFQCDLPSHFLQPIVDKINTYFNQFCYHAVSEYINRKNLELNEKTHFISENHKDKLAVLGQISSSFVHEFRNPLTAVMGFTKILKQEYPELKYLDIIEHELNQLNFRIAQFLHTSKAEINEQRRENVSLIDLFSDLQELIYPSIADSQINVIPDVPEDLIISAHKDELKQVLLNLIMNSIDALKQQEKVRNLIITCQNSHDTLIISISNNGPVIAPDYKKTIFEPFFTTKELGTGIGLFVCKKIIEKHGGSISCESNDELTTFSVILPKNVNPE